LEKSRALADDRLANSHCERHWPGQAHVRRVFNIPRIGRVKVAHGADAVDGAFATIYGEANLNYFQVWAYQVNPQQVSVGDPIDLSKRLDGTQTVRLS
jgi:hypothetical protein